MIEAISKPITLAVVFYTIVELGKYVRDRKNFGLTEAQDLRQKKVEEQVETINNYLQRHHDINEDRQERILKLLEDISDNVFKTSVIMEHIVNLINKEEK